MDGWRERIDRCNDGWMDARMDAWIHVWMDGRMDGWMHEMMPGWTQTCMTGINMV